MKHLAALVMRGLSLSLAIAPTVFHVDATATDTTGTLAVTLERVGYGMPAWVYVDGRIVARDIPPDDDSASKARRKQIQVRVPAGRHIVDLVVQQQWTRKTFPNETFPFDYRSRQTIEMTPGALLDLSLDARWVGGGNSVTALNNLHLGMDWEGWLDQTERSVNQRIEELNRMKIVAVLRSVLRSASAPAGAPGTLRLEFPDFAGGVREYDPTQLRVLANWLEGFWWWFPGGCWANDKGVPFPSDPVNAKWSDYSREIDCAASIPDDLRPRLEQLTKNVNAQRQEARRLLQVADHLAPAIP